MTDESPAVNRQGAEAAPPPAGQPQPASDLPEGVACCTYGDFSRIRLTVAEIIAAEPHPNADKLIKIRIRLGEREKQICAGIRAYYEPGSLVGRRIVVVDNLEPRKLRGEISQGMLLAAHGPDDAISLVTVDNPAFPSGGQVS
ncbi:MAG: methionine--tRNA ligase subunit beta [Planctomycetota bacterium]|jgi:methionyl-tRNA synthetase|nr:methionine--tRNA ligase subunit beta [Planctomycetota bacterium]